MIIFLWSIFCAIIASDHSLGERSFMRVTSTRGDWIGLAYWTECPYQVDCISSPDNWGIGHEIVYRLIFYTQDTRLLEKFRAVFKKAFGLSQQHYDIAQATEVGSSVFWRVYWDRGELDLRLLEKCENGLDKAAEVGGTRIVVVQMMIIPRSLDYIHQAVEANK